MPRLRRWAFNTAAIVSALLLVATLVLWVTSYKDWDSRLFIRSGSYFYHMESWHGGISIGYVQSVEGKWEDDTNATSRTGAWAYPLFRDWWFDWIEGGISSTPGNDYFIEWISVPDWLPSLLLSIFPILAFRRYVRRRKALLAGAVPCPRCGYDLRASKLACPECGQPIPAPPIA